jgi:hypothetical protein
MTASARSAVMISLFANVATRKQRGTFDVTQAVSLRANQQFELRAQTNSLRYTRKPTVCVTRAN